MYPFNFLLLDPYPDFFTTTIIKECSIIHRLYFFNLKTITKKIFGEGHIPLVIIIKNIMDHVLNTILLLIVTCPENLCSLF